MSDIQLPNDYAESRTLLYWALTANYLTSDKIEKIASLFNKRKVKIKQYLESWMQQGLIGHLDKEDFRNTTYYYIQPAVWLKLIEELNSSELNTRINKLRTSFPSRSEVPDDMIDFTRAVVRFKEGKSFVACLEDLDFLWYVFLDDEAPFPVMVLTHIMPDEKWHKFIEGLSIDLFEWLTSEYFRKLQYDICTEEEINALKKLILNRPELDEKDKYTLNNYILLQEFLLRRGCLQELMENESVDKSFLSLLSNIALVKLGQYDEAVKKFRRYLRAEDENYFETSIFNFYYGVALLYATPSVSKPSFKMIHELIQYENLQQGALAILAEIAQSGVTHMKSKEISLPKESDLEAAFIILVAKHFGLMIPAGADRILQRIQSEGIKLLQLEYLHDEPSLGGETVSQECDMKPSLHPYVVKPAWEETLDALLIMSNPARSSKTAEKKTSSKRIVYAVDTNN